MIEWRGTDAILQYTLVWISFICFYAGIRAGNKRPFGWHIWIRWYLGGLLLLLIFLEFRGTMPYAH